MPPNTAEDIQGAQSQTKPQENQPQSGGTQSKSGERNQPQTGQSSTDSTSVPASRPSGGTAARRGMSGPAFPSPGDFFANPFGVMRRMHEEMDRAFAEAFGQGGMGTAQGASQNANWVPAIEVSENKGNLVVHAELAGVRPEDIQLEVENDTLVLTGRRERSEAHNEGGIRRSERVYGSFYRAIPLPEGADPDKARAEFNHGVLEITLPVAQPQPQTRRIPISGSGATGSESKTNAQKASA